MARMASRHALARAIVQTEKMAEVIVSVGEFQQVEPVKTVEKKKKSSMYMIMQKRGFKQLRAQ
jgi:hypothetical protein